MQNYFYFNNAASKGTEEIKLYTKEASYISGLLREYAVVILNVQEDRYKPVGHTRAKRKADEFEGIREDIDEAGEGGSDADTDTDTDTDADTDAEPDTETEAASRIQAWIRSYLIRSRFRRICAVLVIQSFGRVIVAKRVWKKLKEEERALKAEMNRILEWKKAEEERVRAEEEKERERVRAKEERERAEKRKEEERVREEREKEGEAAVFIQKTFRGGKLRSQILKMEEDIRVEEAAVTIQSRFRGGKLRTQIMLMADDIEEEGGEGDGDEGN